MCLQSLKIIHTYQPYLLNKHYFTSVNIKTNKHISDQPPPPPITPLTAGVLIVIYALIYFLPFYFSSLTRPSPTLSRDAPSVIKARITSVTISCFICCFTTYLILVPPSFLRKEPKAGDGSLSNGHVLHLMGLWPLALTESLRALVLTMLLFLGPLFAYFVVESGWRDWLRLEPFKEIWSDWTVWRNLVAGPITEEILFRSASIPLMLASGTSLNKTIFLTPVIFGLSHVHHFYEFRLSNPQVPAKMALFRSIFQFGFTTLFGAYATFIFLRTGSLVAVCAVHAFCNSMGLPRLWGRVEPPPNEAEVEGGRRQGQEQGERRPSILWTVGYYTLLVAGAVSWYRNLWVLTGGGNGLVPEEAWS
ncbi:hypothetical protein V8F20_003721 [Naviculisporaceae sp. PSN 640]